ncbi:hypothetical protein [Aeromicrobium sp.]|uniref:hypothetical protein n=1 Tax=Aeromicrobium sp. TaxID=1871063 RepID=UPI002FCCAC00
MTAIQHFQAPTIRISSNVVRNAAFVGKALAGTAALVALTVATVAFASAVEITTTMYFFVLVSTVGAIAALGIRENRNEAMKTKYDIR